MYIWASKSYIIIMIKNPHLLHISRDISTFHEIIKNKNTASINKHKHYLILKGL